VDDAAGLYHQILDIDPRQADALSLLGQIDLFHGHQAQGEARIQMALQVQPHAPHFRIALASAYRVRSAPDLAIVQYCYALALEPAHFDALANLGIMLSDGGKLDAALRNYLHASHLRRDVPALLSNLAGLLKDAGRFDEAIATYLDALRLQSDLPELHFNLAMTFWDIGRQADASACLAQALVLKPDWSPALENQAIFLTALERRNDALILWLKLLAIEPARPRGLAGLADALYAANYSRASTRFYPRALLFDRDNSDLWSNYASATYGAGHRLEAVPLYEAAILLKPANSQSYFNLANVLGDIGLMPDCVRAYERSVWANPDNPAARYNLAMAYLKQGQFIQGWAEYEWRWQSGKMVPRNFGVPRWHGEPLSGQHILLHAEQGLGDCVQFARYVPLVAALGAKITVEAPAPIASLMKSLPCSVDVIPRGAAVPPMDLECPLMSLPLIFATTLETIPAGVPYLSANQDRIAAWRRWLGTTRKLRIGLNWQGNPNYAHDGDRSMPLRHLAPLAGMPDVDLIVLQQNEGLEQIDRVSFGRTLRLPKAEGHQYDDTAALMSALDLIVTTDTSIAHVAGALACPTILLLGFNADWRWLRGRDDCPWYPSFRLARQPNPGDWPGAVATALTYIEQRLAARKAV
jgi:tetratricopeptide (TPR) repeat protein